jgi:hypothetical protein
MKRRKLLLATFLITNVFLNSDSLARGGRGGFRSHHNEETPTNNSGDSFRFPSSSFRSPQTQPNQNQTSGVNASETTISNAQPQATQPKVPTATVQTKCPDVPPPEKYATHITWHGSQYVGQVKNGKPNGIGHLFRNPHSQYYGNWLDGFEHGRGIECTDSGDIYDGEWAYGIHEGEGVFTWGGDKQGHGSFSGKFLANVPVGGNQTTSIGDIERKSVSENGSYHYHGGILTITLTDTISSTYSITLQHGKGIDHHPDGSRYKGEFKNGMNNGFGIQYASNGKPTYAGEWRNGMRHGFGVYSHDGGQKYEGEWINGEESGFGVYTFPSGQKYEGFLRDGKKNGFGIYYYENGSIEQGEWRDDKQVGSR